MTSIKFRPGLLSKFATHAVVMAKMIIKGKDYGVTPFLVPLLNIDKLEYKEGIEAHDMGPKLSFECLTQSVMKFTNVRIPRTNLVQ